MGKSKNQIGTFALNKIESIHRWYSYIEGYSSHFVIDILASLREENIHTIYDPFCGSGTTPLVASQNNIKPYYSETNPFMQSIIDTKINVVRRIKNNEQKIKIIKQLQKNITIFTYQGSLLLPSWNGFEKFFEPEQLEAILFIKNTIEKLTDDDCRALCMLALSSILVTSSKMIRRGDLRFAKEQEKRKQDRDVIGNFKNKLADILTDIGSSADSLKFDAELISEDARDLNVKDYFDCIITSPPYLNGTNYIRNTKLELKLNGYLSSEADTPSFHERGIIAGINNVSKRNGEIKILPCVQSYIENLKQVAYDKRIVNMVAGYFYDMDKVIERLTHALKDGGIFIMDIGDSQFAGIHIPTHDILSNICAGYGFKKIGEDIQRKRYSKNGMGLSQRLLKFRLEKKSSPKVFLEGKAQNFIINLPYKSEPFFGRNWGHSWHSLCSYHGKLKPAIAHMLVKNFSNLNETVLDPLCGVGTIPFEACLQGRIGIGNDLSEMAYVVSKAKLEKPAIQDVLSTLNILENYIENNKHSINISNLKLKYKDFGFNGKIDEYFDNATYSEILCAREYLKNDIRSKSSSICMIYACLLHILHGNRPYALSRNSHPLTPYAPTGKYIYKNVIQHIRAKIELSYKEKNFDHYIAGSTILGDYQNINCLNEKIDVIICSPPFAGSIRFYMNNWLRLWLCGWEQEDYKSADKTFIDSKQKCSFSIYDSFFSMCNNVLKANGRVILHLGKTSKYNMAVELIPYASKWFEVAFVGEENVEKIEKHGIKDKGGTTEHQFLFLIKK